MSAAAFDTLGVARNLEAAGLDRDPAEAIARAIHHGGERAATKADLDTTTAGFRADLAELRADLDNATATLRADLDTATTALRADLDTAITALRAATKADLDTATAGFRADLAELRADLYRALWIQGISIVTLIGGLIAIAAALELL